MYVYNNKSSFQTSYINGSSMLNGNSMAKGSKLNPDSMSISHSRSYGEIIIDGKMNPEMKGDKDFKNFLDENFYHKLKRCYISKSYASPLSLSKLNL